GASSYSDVHDDASAHWAINWLLNRRTGHPRRLVSTATWETCADISRSCQGIHEHCRPAPDQLGTAPAVSRSRAASRIGGAPKRLLYSRLKCAASLYPTRVA